MPCDFWLWGIVKECVYSRKIRDINDLKDRIRTVVSSEMCVRALKKLRVALWGFFNTAAVRPIVFLPQQVPAFISRGATHHIDARDLYQRRREILPMNFASKSVIHENPLGSFTCRKGETWDILFCFPSEGRHTEDFPDVRKIQRLRPGLNPRTRVPVASMLTTRPPKPSCPGFKWYCCSLVIVCSTRRRTG